MEVFCEYIMSHNGTLSLWYESIMYGVHANIVSHSNLVDLVSLIEKLIHNKCESRWIEGIG